MIIIWGTLPYFRTNKVKQHGICPHCSRLVKMQSYFARECFHLYYIPLIPFRARCRYHQICSSCQQGVQLEASKFESLLHELRTSSAEAVLAVLNDESTFIPVEGKEPVEAVPYLMDALDWLYAAGDIEFCGGVWNQLQGINHKYARWMLEARKFVRDGQVDRAIEAYHDAHLTEPDLTLPLESKGQLLMLSKKYGAAIGCLSKLIELVSDQPGKLSIYLSQLADCQVESKRFDEAVKTFHRILALRPDLQSEKAFMKLVHKTRKKAGA